MDLQPIRAQDVTCGNSNTMPGYGSWSVFKQERNGGLVTDVIRLQPNGSLQYDSENF